MIDFNSPQSLYNWVEDLDLRCASNYEISMFGAIFFIGHVIGTSLLAKYGDIKGRIYTLKYSLIFSSIIFGLLVFVSREY